MQCTAELHRAPKPSKASHQAHDSASTAHDVEATNETVPLQCPGSGGLLGLQTSMHVFALMKDFSTPGYYQRIAGMSEQQISQVCKHALRSHKKANETSHSTRQELFLGSPALIVVCIQGVLSYSKPGQWAPFLPGVLSLPCIPQLSCTLLHILLRLLSGHTHLQMSMLFTWRAFNDGRCRSTLQDLDSQ